MFSLANSQIEHILVLSNLILPVNKKIGHDIVAKWPKIRLAPLLARQ